MPQSDSTKDDGTLSRSTNPMHADDNELAKRVLMGETQVFRLLIERHQRYIFNLCYRMLQRSEEADDATQNTFLKAYRSIKQFRGDARLKTWLSRIARNECLNRLRDEKIISPDEQPTTDCGFELADSAPSPLGLIEQQETQSIVHAAIDELPHPYRLAVTLFHLDGLSYEEISRMMEIPMGTVKTHIFRARILLKSKLQAYVEGKM